jgi:hypothetical protein
MVCSPWSVTVNGVRGRAAALSGLVLGVAGVGIGFAAGAGPAWADCCPASGSAAAGSTAAGAPHVGAALGSTVAPSVSALATTGAAVTVAAAVGLAFMATGAVLIAATGRRWRWLPRPRVLGAGAAILVAATLLSGGTAAAAPRPVTVAGECCPGTITPAPSPGSSSPGSSSPGSGASTPTTIAAVVLPAFGTPVAPPVVPEAPLPVLLPLVGAAVVALAVFRQRRSRPQAAAHTQR